MSYVLCLESMERVTLAYVQAAALARLLGARTEMPDWFEVRADFDRVLAAPPEGVDVKESAMLQAVGLRG